MADGTRAAPKTYEGSTHSQIDESVDASGFELGVVLLMPLLLFVRILFNSGRSRVSEKQHVGGQYSADPDLAPRSTCRLSISS